MVEQMNEENKAVGLKPSEDKRGVWREIWEFAKVILLALAIALPIRYFIAQPFIVKGQSMEPSFEDREYLVIDELTYQFREPERGEVIVFRYPNNTKEFFIKRIIGLPGESVAIKNGQVLIGSSGNGGQPVALSESYLPSDLKTFPEKEYVLGEAQYLVLGDNRRNSSDSRIWGPLDKKFITGRAFFRAWPPGKFGLIPEPTY